MKFYINHELETDLSLLVLEEIPVNVRYGYNAHEAYLCCYTPKYLLVIAKCGSYYNEIREWNEREESTKSWDLDVYNNREPIIHQQIVRLEKIRDDFFKEGLVLIREGKILNAIPIEYVEGCIEIGDLVKTPLSDHLYVDTVITRVNSWCTCHGPDWDSSERDSISSAQSSLGSCYALVSVKTEERDHGSTTTMVFKKKHLIN